MAKTEKIQKSENEKTAKQKTRKTEKNIEAHAKYESQIAELTNQLQRLQAEFENYIKRQEREQQDRIKFAKKNILKDLIIVYDDFERAISQSKNLSEGIQMVYRELEKILSHEGVHPIKALGKPFNPDLHEVLMTIVNKDKDENTVVEEFQRGYLIHDKVLRHSKVKITKHEKA